MKLDINEARKTEHIRSISHDKSLQLEINQEILNLKNMYRNLNEHRYERKNDYLKQVFMSQLKKHHDYCESFVQGRVN